MRKPRGALVAVLLAAGVAAVGLTSCGGTGQGSGGSGQGEHGEHKEEVAKGPHGGRLLTDGDFAVEVTIFERGVPPEYRVYAFEKGQPIDPASVKLGIALHRIGGRVDRIGFQQRGDYLVGDQVIEEPHSFKVDVTADNRGRAHRWEYESWEGRTEISPEAIASSEISIETVAPATIRTTITTHGRIVPNEEHLAHVIPRYPGVVREVRKRLGEAVAKGEVVAVVESNQSLQPYEVRSPLAGTVIAKDVLPGEYAREGDVIYTVADLGTVWADLNVHHQDFTDVKLGQTVSLETGQGIARTVGTIVYVSPFGARDTQTLLARAVVSNPDGAWRPGLFVTGRITVDETEVPAAVKASALHTFRDWDVVFLNEGTVFQAMPVELGRHDGEWVEITAGVAPGQRYAAENSFVVKADVGKSGASHDH